MALENYEMSKFELRSDELKCKSECLFYEKIILYENAIYFHLGRKRSIMLFNFAWLFQFNMVHCHCDVCVSK